MKVTFNNGAVKKEVVEVEADEVRYTTGLVKFYVADTLVEVFMAGDVIDIETAQRKATHLELLKVAK